MGLAHFKRVPYMLSLDARKVAGENFLPVPIVTIPATPPINDFLGTILNEI